MKRRLIQIHNISKSQVCAAHRFLVVYRKVSRKLKELCVGTPCWCTNMGHQYGGQKIR